MKPLLNKNDRIELSVGDIGMNGEGIAHYNGAAVFVKNALPGEKIKAKIICAKNKVCFAKIEEILVKSPERETPPCPYYLKCGGCDMQHIRYESQLEYKAKALINTLKKQLPEPLPVLPAVPSDRRYNYRNKLSLPVRGENAAMGFFASSSHRLIEIDDCLLQSFDARKLIEIFKKFMETAGLAGYDEESQKGSVRHLIARETAGRLFVTVVLKKRINGALRLFNEKLYAEYGGLYALYANYNDQKSNVILSQDFEFIGGNDSFILTDGLKLKYHPAAFFQVNDAVRNKLYSAVREAFPDDEKGKKNVLIDAYAGAGILSAIMSKSFEKVYSVEINVKAHEAAKELKETNGISNLICVQGDCAQELPKITALEKGEGLGIILDPPRSGVSEKVIKSVLESRAPTVVYISCDPATLARDLKLLSERYGIASITPFDMFPQTAHIETLTVLKKII